MENEVPPVCRCGLLCRKWIAGTARNRGRKFWGCQKGREVGNCNFFVVETWTRIGEGEGSRNAAQNVQNQVKRERSMFMVSALSWMLANRAIIRAILLEERNRDLQLQQQNRNRETWKKLWYFMIFIVGFVAYKMLVDE